MIHKTVKSLLIEDNPGDAYLIQRMLCEGRQEKFEVEWVTCLVDGLERLGKGGVDVVLLDLGLPDSQGLDTFVRAYAHTPSVPIVVLTGLADENMGLNAVRQGAQDYLIKGEVDSKPLFRAIRFAAERKQAEEALRRLNDELEQRVQERTSQLKRQAELLQDLYDNAPCGYHSLDKNGLFVRINNTALEWLGYTHDEVVGQMKFSDLLTPEGQKRFQELFSHLKEREQVRGLEFDLLRKDGTFLPVLLNATAIPENSSKYLISRNTIFDISERKRTEQALKEFEEKLRFLASRLLSAQEDVRKNIAWELHEDLGQSLTALKFQICALLRDLPESIPGAKSESEAVLNYLKEIVGKMRSIANKLRPPVLDLGLMRAINSLLQELLLTQKIDFIDDLCCLEGLFSPSGQIIIYRVFQEALSNIVKHANATRVAITATKQNCLVTFRIDDNGQGFALGKDQRSKIQDHGLGIMTMDERVRLLGGNLQISSVKGKGTSVVFTVPVSPLQKQQF